MCQFGREKDDHSGCYQDESDDCVGQPRTGRSCRRQVSRTVWMRSIQRLS